MQIKDTIKDLRKNKVKLTQVEFAEIMNCNRQKIADWERGKSMPGADDIVLLCEKFNVSADYILGLTPNPTNDQGKQFVCEYTNLSENSIDFLHSAWGMAESDIINFFFDDANSIEFGALCDNLRQYNASYNKLLDHQESIAKSSDKEISQIDEYNRLKDDKDLKEFRLIKSFNDIVQAYCRTEIQRQDKCKSDFEEKIKQLFDKFQPELFGIEDGGTNGNNPKT